MPEAPRRNNVTDRDRALEALGRLKPWRADDRKEWLRVGMALQSASDDLFDAWDQWSRQSQKYNRKAMRTTWRSFRADDGIGLGSLIAMAKEDDPSYNPSSDRQQASSTPPAPSSSSAGGKPKRTYPTWDAIIKAVERDTYGAYVAHWSYPDGFFEVRVSLPRGSRPNGKDKDYRPVHQTADGYVIGDPPGKLPLYNRDAIAGECHVHIFEGPKKADLAIRLGLVAITSAHGANAARKSDWTPLAGKNATIYPDKDDNGWRYAQDVAKIAAGLNPPARVSVVDLPVGKSEDLEQWLAHRDSQEPEVIKAALLALPSRQDTAAAGSLGKVPRSRWRQARLILYSQLSLSERILLWVLWDLQGTNAVAWPSKSFLAGKVGCDPRHISRLKQDLRAKGLLDQSDRKGRSSQYNVNLEPLLRMMSTHDAGVMGREGDDCRSEQVVNP